MRKADKHVLQSISTLFTKKDLDNPQTKEMFYGAIVHGELHPYCKLELPKRATLPDGRVVIWSDQKPAPCIQIPEYLYKQMKGEIDRDQCKIIKYQIDDLYDQLVKFMKERKEPAPRKPRKSTVSKKATTKRETKMTTIKLVTCPICQTEEFHVMTKDMDPRCNSCKLMNVTSSVKAGSSLKNQTLYDPKTESYVQFDKKDIPVHVMRREAVDNMCNMW